MVIVAALLALAGLIYLIAKAAQAAAERERQRKAALAGWAAINGFEFAEGDPWNLDGRYNGLVDIGRGHNRYAFEVLYRREPRPCFIFRYHFQTTETRTVTHRDSQGNSYTTTQQYEEDHWRRYLLLELGAQFPTIFIRPEGWGDKLAAFVGFDDIDFESEEFSKRYFCKSDNRQFAYAVIHPQMMEWLLPQHFAAQLTRGLLLMELGNRQHTAPDCHEALTQAAGFINRIPPFVWQDYAHTDAVHLPQPVPLNEFVPGLLEGMPSPVR